MGLKGTCGHTPAAQLSHRSSLHLQRRGETAFLLTLSSRYSFSSSSMHLWSLLLCYLSCFGLCIHPVFLLGESHGQRSLGGGGYSLGGCKELDMTEHAHVASERIHLCSQMTVSTASFIGQDQASFMCIGILPGVRPPGSNTDM